MTPGARGHVDILHGMTTAATVKVRPAVLRWAREHSAATIDDAAARAKQTREVVEEWEAGTSQPTLVVLRELATLYGVPLTLFMLSKPPQVQPRPVDLRAFAGVVRPEPSLELAKALNRASALQMVAHDLMRELGRPLPSPAHADQGDAESLAETHRPFLGISLDEQRKWKDERAALRAWRAAVERRGIYVLQFPMRKAEVRAFSLSQRPSIIVLNQSDFVRSRVFSLLHEYAHVLLGTGAICLPGSGRRAMEQTASVEVFCNRFAGAVLVPGDALKREPLAMKISRAKAVPDSDDLDRLARRFHVSSAVAWYRMRHLDLVSPTVFTKKWEDWDRFPIPPEGGGGMTTGERVLSMYGPGLAGLVLDAAASNVLTPADAGQYLGFQPWRQGDVQSELADRAAV
jgi:Zn-dependent peptidase ImmA (M78 family)